MLDYNSGMFALEGEELRQSQADATAWCAVQLPRISTFDKSEVNRRHALLDRSNRLWEQAQAIAKSNSAKRKVFEIAEGREARSLWEEIRASLGPLEHHLRSASLKPSLALDTLREEADWARAVSEVINRRHQLLDRISPERPSTGEHEGRLLLYYTYENLADGAAELSSNGFFDVDNIPPWDTWVSFSEGVLLSWVPHALVDAAEMGIEANPEECIRWAALDPNI